MSTVVGLFESRDQAQRAVEALKQTGLRAEDMSIVMRDRTEAADVAEDVGAGSGSGAAAGAVGGGILGGLGGLLVGVGALAIPGIGPIVAAGPLAAALAGAGLGAATGGLLGALTDAGVPEEEAPHYQAGVERGGILLTVNAPDGREDEVRSILSRNGLQDLSYHRSQW
ncbi:MAG TPA: general stress protein, partial [Isosphaeraceae bacterium]